MSKRTARLLSLIFIGIFALSFSLCAFAGKEGDLLYDGADLLSDYEEQELEALLSEKSAEAGVTIAIVTVNDFTEYEFYGFKEEYMQDFSDDYYGNYFGQNSDGILLSLSMNDRSYHISTSGSCLENLSDSDIAKIEDAVISRLSNGYYADAFETFVTKVVEELIPLTKGERIIKKAPTFGLASIIVGAISAFGATGSMKGKLKSVSNQKNAAVYAISDSLNIANQADVFLYRNVVATPRPKETSSSSKGGGGTSVHTSHGGGSYGGHGGHF
ncbi:MAG: TPM domain-containing protein [Clostridia bacterium]|nr:TPM domain-containing protein [Clostridia bacterium]